MIKLYIISFVSLTAQINQNGDQMNVGGCGMNKLRSLYTSCEVDLMYGEKQGLGYDCSCQVFFL